VRIIRVLLIVIGLALIGLGTIPVDQSRLFHDINAVTVIVGFGGLILATPSLLRGLPRPFLVSTAMLGALIVGIVGLWKPFHVYNFTAVELLAVLVIFAWLALFARTVGSGPSAQLETEPEAETVRTPAELDVAPPSPDPSPVLPRAIEIPQRRQPVALLLAAGIGVAAGAALVTLVRRRD
ncbi:MAG TPA: hypothetical protein VF312_06760, partial [Propionibacteriaceae bacterium]